MESKKRYTKPYVEVVEIGMNQAIATCNNMPQEYFITSNQYLYEDKDVDGMTDSYGTNQSPRPAVYKNGIRNTYAPSDGSVNWDNALPGVLHENKVPGMTAGASVWYWKVAYNKFYAVSASQVSRGIFNS